MGRFCLTTVVDAKYSGYLPLWFYCIGRSYPEYDAIAFLRDCEAPPVDGHAGQVVVDDELGGYPQERDLTASLRWVLFTPARAQRWFAGYDGVVVTDADILYMRDSVPMMDCHLRHCKVLRLPYSALVRSVATPVMSAGLFATAEFIKRIGPTTQEYDRRLRQVGMKAMDTPAKIPNERILYQIVRDSGIGLPPQHRRGEGAPFYDPANYREVWYKPWHGLHLGYVRPVAGAEKRWHLALTEQPWLRRYMDTLLSWENDAGWQRAFEALPAEGKDIWRRMVSGYKDYQHG